MAKNFEQLAKDLQSDAALLKEFQEAKIAKDDKEGIIAFAAKKGYTITEDDIRSISDNELSPEELEKISGGGYYDVDNMTPEEIAKVVEKCADYESLTASDIANIIFCHIVSSIALLF